MTDRWLFLGIGSMIVFLWMDDHKMLALTVAMALVLAWGATHPRKK